MAADVPVDAVVLVGGKGTRLRPLTLSTPKPMLPTAGVPFLSHLLSRLRDAGLRHVILGTSYRAEVFEEYFGDGSAIGLELDYVFEAEPLGTGGAIRNVLDRLRTEHVLVCNGDILSGADLNELLATHHKTDADATLLLKRVDDPTRFGSVPTDDDGRVLAFLEKTLNPPTDQINAGFTVFRRSVIEAIPTGRPVSVEYETYPGLLEAGARIQGFVDPSYWLDVGSPETLVRASADLVRGIAPTSVLPGQVGESLSLTDVEIAETATVSDGSTIGNRAIIGENAVVRGSLLLDDVVVSDDAVVESSVLGVGVQIGKGAVLRDVTIGDGAVIGADCELLAGARIWPNVKLADGSVRFSPGP